MSFEIGKKISMDGITLEDLLKGVKSEKEKQNVISIFNRFNTDNSDENGKQVLDRKEQNALYSFLAKLSFGDGNVTRKDVRDENEQSSTKNKYSQIRDFVAAFERVIVGSQKTIDAKNFVIGEDGGYSVTEDNGIVTTYNSKNEVIEKKDSLGRKLFEIGAFDKKFSYKYNNDDPNAKPFQVTIVKSNGRTEDYFYIDRLDCYYSYTNSSYDYFTLGPNIMLQSSQVDMMPKIMNSNSATNTQEQGQSQQTSQTQIEQQNYEIPDNRPMMPAKRSRVHMPKEWNNRQTSLPEGIQESKTADEVLEKLLPSGVTLTDEQKNQLKADLIKYNPSVFNAAGQVYKNALWTKLDFLSEENIQRKYAADTAAQPEASINDEEAVQTDNQPDETRANAAKPPKKKAVASDGVMNRDYTPVYIKTACNGVVYNETDGQHYRQQGDQFTLIKPKFQGYKISEFKSDGSHIEKLVKGSQTVLVSVSANGKATGQDFYVNGKKTSHYGFYNNGAKKSDTRYENGQKSHINYFAPDGKTNTATFDYRNSELFIKPYIVKNKYIVFVNGCHYEVPNAGTASRDAVKRAFAERFKRAGVQFQKISVLFPNGTIA